MARNKKRLNQWMREYYHKRKNDPVYKERRKLSALKYYQNHKKETAIRHREYFLKNKEAYRKYRKEWNYTSPYGIYAVIKNGLTNKKSPRKYLIKISKEDFAKWYTLQEKKCFYCGRTYEQCLADPFNRKANRLTIDRIDNAKGYEKGNIALACLRCNAIKSNYFTKDEMFKIGVIISKK